MIIVIFDFVTADEQSAGVVSGAIIDNYDFTFQIGRLQECDSTVNGKGNNMIAIKSGNNNRKIQRRIFQNLFFPYIDKVFFVFRPKQEKHFS